MPWEILGIVKALCMLKEKFNGSPNIVRLLVALPPLPMNLVPGRKLFIVTPLRLVATALRELIKLLLECALDAARVVSKHAWVLPRLRKEGSTRAVPSIRLIRLVTPLSRLPFRRQVPPITLTPGLVRSPHRPPRRRIRRPSPLKPFRVLVTGRRPSRFLVLERPVLVSRRIVAANDGSARRVRPLMILATFRIAVTLSLMNGTPVVMPYSELRVTRPVRVARRRVRVTDVRDVVVLPSPVGLPTVDSEDTVRDLRVPMSPVRPHSRTLNIVVTVSSMTSIVSITSAIPCVARPLCTVRVRRFTSRLLNYQVSNPITLVYHRVIRYFPPWLLNETLSRLTIRIEGKL